MTQAGPGWLKRAAFLAAEVARRFEPQLAYVYHRAMVEKGKVHTQTVCEVAAHLLDRVFCVLKEERPFEYRDLNQKPIKKKAAQALAEEWKVPESVRQRLRRRKVTVQKQGRERKNVRAPAAKAVPVNTLPSIKKHTIPIAVRSSTSTNPEALGEALKQMFESAGSGKVVDNFFQSRT